ncbi:aKG-HExxH-type peptide beta-hydroxylase [Streptomyces sp. NPDC102467]|uniref:aKG-HExxH-type peptide beta-hydroxylase n=1 Tax=Streptomyces sp. NPDC102467 TaxID=3366179 RepID=UPI00380F5E37
MSVPVLRTPVGAPFVEATWTRLAAGLLTGREIRAMWTALAQRNLLLLGIVHQHHRDNADWRQAIDVTRASRAGDPSGFAGFLALPATGSWLARAARSPAMSEPSDWLRFALAMALLTSTDADLTVPAGPASTLSLPGLGTARPTEPGVFPRLHARTARDAESGIRLSLPGSGVPLPHSWSPQARLTLSAGPRGPRTSVQLDTADAYALTAGLGTAAPVSSHWQRLLAQGWQRLARIAPARARVVGRVLHVAVPLPPTGTNGWSSASHADAAGLVALAPLDSPAATAAALVHETEHSLLAMADSVHPLLAATPGTLLPAPWSAVPRPPHALLHGAAAFLVTAAYWRTERRAGNPAAADQEEHCLMLARTAASTLLASGCCLPPGRSVATAVRAAAHRWHH